MRRKNWLKEKQNKVFKNGFVIEWGIQVLSDGEAYVC